MDYYKTLGLDKGASIEEIKKAYRSLAMKHHPDRGGDEAKFKEIAAAYEALSNPEKKKIIDMGMDPNSNYQNHQGYHQGPFEFNFGSGNFDDILRSFRFGNGYGFSRQQSIRRNKSVSIQVRIDLEDVLLGKEFDAEISIPNGRKKIINIKIPPGVEHGQQIRYQGMGDDLYKDLPPGDLLLNIIVNQHPEFERHKDSIICEKSISVWDAILGSELEISSLNNRKFKVSVPSGTQPGTILSCKGEGLPRLNQLNRGDLLVKIKIEIPKNISDTQKHLIETIKKNGI